MKSLLIIAASAASAGLLVPTLAEARTEPGYEQVSKTVGYSDLDLTKAKDEQRLERRVAVAIRKMCGDQRKLSAAASVEFRACVDDAQIEAKREIRLAVRQATVRKGSA
ncbi:MAG TPA: UrcA family protein [Sphingomicrobium sp.]|nr:UrcA family protein [Sphingomicrobium sp.]